LSYKIDYISLIYDFVSKTYEKLNKNKNKNNFIKVLYKFQKVLVLKFCLNLNMWWVDANMMIFVLNKEK